MTMWRLAAARATGTSHSKSSLPCQDQFEYATVATDTFVAAVADGAGSASMAERGAEAVVGTVVESVSAAIKSGRTDFTTILMEAAIEARNHVLAIAEDQGVVARELASTLLVVVAGPEGGAALQIGDGVIVVSDGGEGWSWVFWPQHGEYANTTCFLTDEDAEKIVQVEAFGMAVSDIALMTDGLEPLALHYASQTPHHPFFNGIFGPLVMAEHEDDVKLVSENLGKFLSSERVATRTDDDMTIVIATRRRNKPNP